MPVALVTNARDFAGPPAVDALCDAGFRVLVQDPGFDEDSQKAAYRSAHPSSEPIESPPAGPADMIASAWEQAGQVDVIISNDHFPAVQGPTEAVSLDSFRQTLESLVVDPFAMLQAAIPRFKAQGAGAVVMIMSCRTSLPMPGGAVPDAARAAVNALVRSLSIELAPYGIPVNAIAPNFLYSEAYFPRSVYVDDPVGRTFVEESVPAGRLGRPEEIGEVIRFLAATKATFLTGAIIDFAGGWPAAPARPQ